MTRLMSFVPRDLLDGLPRSNTSGDSFSSLRLNASTLSESSNQSVEVESDSHYIEVAICFRLLHIRVAW